MIEICFATNNQHKVEEVMAALPKAIRIKTLNDIQCFEELPETSPTLEGNSLQKALYVFEHYNVPCFADDTGLEVSALNGAPGVYSARYAGSARNSVDNMELLLKNLRGIKDRRARFRTVFTLVGLEAEALYFEGVVRGVISENIVGDAGFGYDPVFIPDGHPRTFAEMTLTEKNQISHRAVATRKLADYLTAKVKG